MLNIENEQSILRYLYYLLFSIVLSSCNTQEYADIVFVNGKVITVDSTFSIEEAIAVKGNLILDVGSTKDIETLIGPKTKKLELNGRTILPGLNDAHTHPVLASQDNHLYNLPNIRSLPDLFQWIQKEVEEKKDDEWIIHPRLFATRLKELRQPTRQELDSLAPNNPIFLNGSFAGMINTKAMQISGITRDVDHEGVLKNIAGELTGYIRGSAFELLAIENVQNLLSEKEKLAALQVLLREYNKVGITSICSGSGDSEHINLFRKLKENGDLSVRVFQNISAPFDVHSSEDEIRSSLLALGYSTGDGDEWVKVGALKIVADGGILTGTAYLREPWGEETKDIYGIYDTNYRGILNISREEMAGIIRISSELGWKFTAHATGGGAVDELLSAFDEVNKILPITKSRHSIIHGNFYNAESINTMNKLRIYGDVQPAWYYKDADLMYNLLGDVRVKSFQPYRSMIAAHIILNGGSDHMVKSDSYASINPYNPFLTLDVLVNRITENGNIYNYEERISREEAIKMLTIYNARASFEEDIKGSLEIGKLADLIVVSNDVLACEAKDIKATKVELTMLDGKIIYTIRK